MWLKILHPTKPKMDGEDGKDGDLLVILGVGSCSEGLSCSQMPSKCRCFKMSLGALCSLWGSFSYQLGHPLPLWLDTLLLPFPYKETQKDLKLEMWELLLHVMEGLR